MVKKVKISLFGAFMILSLISCTGGASQEAPTTNPTEMAIYLTAVAQWSIGTPSRSVFDKSLTPTVTLTDTPTPTPTVTPIPKVLSTELATGMEHTCALTPQGGVMCWGNNANGQLGVEGLMNSSEPLDVTGLEMGVSAIAARNDHTCALLDDGGVICWGIDGSVPTVVERLHGKATAIDVGQSHACALLDSGEVQCWGDNEFGQLGNGTLESSITAVDVKGLNGGVTAIATGRNHSCGLIEDGGVECWGQSLWGEIGEDDTDRRTTPAGVVGISDKVKIIKAGDMHNCVILIGGGLQCWGANGYGKLGNQSNENSALPVHVFGLSSGVRGISAGMNHTCALVDDNTMKCWGSNGSGQLGLGSGANNNYSEPETVRWRLAGITGMATGWRHTCVKFSNGGLKCWGGNEFGQLGNGTTKSSPDPVDVVGLSEVLATHTPIPQYKAIAISQQCILTSGGGVMCWGRNSAGQLGDGTNVESNIPVFVEGLTSGVTAIASAHGTVCAITISGGLQCWGSNYYGLLGDGTTTDSNRPVDVIGLDRDVVAIGIGPRQSCAALRNGGLKCWGKNEYGQLGIGNYDGTTYTTPVDVVGLNDTIKMVALDHSVSCALTIKGAVKCWGTSSDGQLGNGEVTTSYIPTQVIGLTSGIISISLGGNTAFALTEDGRVMGWGKNCCGEILDGTRINRTIPVFNVLPPGIVNVVSAGYPKALIDNRFLISWGVSGAYLVMDFSSVQGGIIDFCGKCVLTGTGGVKCWGDNSFGQLGDGTYRTSETPVDVVGFSGVADP
jgi:alpha-tubulin suppressor-like RCC1 family protein